MPYQFLVDTYATERLKVLSVWSMFKDEDLLTRPHPQDRRGRSVLEHMVHQCVSEDFWFRIFLGIVVVSSPLPEKETRIEFIRRYAADSGKRLEALRSKDPTWWLEQVLFFEVRRTCAWVLVRRIAHTAHHRGQQTAMLRMLNRELYSSYGPTADTGGLLQNQARTMYAYPNETALIKGESRGGRKAFLPGPGNRPPTERP